MLRTISKFRSGRVMLLLALLVLLAPAVVFGQAAPFSGPAKVSLSPAAQNIAPGANFTVAVVIDLTGISGSCAAPGDTPAILGGYVIPIDFDNTQVTYVSVAACPTAPPQFADTPTATAPGIANANGEVAISAVSQGDPTGPTGLICVARLTFMLSAAATLPTTLTPDCVGTFSGFSLSSQFIPGCAGSPASMAGTCVASTVTPVEATADLVVVKTDSADPVVAGATLTYTVTASNAGPSDATGVTVVDTLPPGVVFVSATPTQGTCSEAGGVVTCNVGALANGASATITIVVTAPSAAGSINNQATISGAENDPDPSDNSDTETTTVTASTDLVVTKTDSPDPVTAGATLTYTVTASNTGPSDATGVAVVDTLPAGVVFVSATPTQGTCLEAGGVVTCNVGALANGASATIVIVVTAPGATGSINNQVTISGAETDPDPSDNSETEATTVTVLSADLGVTKTDSPDPVAAGGALTYTVTATNSGPDAATVVTVVDTLPAGVGFVSATPSQGSCSQAGGVVTCNVGALANGGSATIVIVVTAALVGPLSNSVSISSADAADPNPANNNDTEATTVTASADVVVTKTDSPDPVVAGATLTYTVTASNAGPSDATGVTVVDTLPPGVVFVSATPTQGTCSEAGGVATCNVGALANGASATITIVVTAPSAAGSINNQATISGAENDPDPSDNSDTEATTVTASTDLVVTKTDSPDPVAAGATLTYTVTASNTGPSDATGVAVVDTLPAGVVFVSATPTQGTCLEAGGVVTCNVGALANGASPTIVIVVTAPGATGPINNQVTISGAETDPDPSDNSETEATTVTAATDLTVSKTDSPDPVVPGATLTYTVTASNTGPSNATGVVVVDTLPAGVIFVSVTPTQGVCSQGSGVVTCIVGVLANGASATITIVVTAPGTAGSISNQATISGAQTDPDPSDNSDTEATTVSDPCAGETVAPVVTPPASTTVDASICAGNLPGATGNSSAPLAAFIAGGSATDNCDLTPTQQPAQVGGADIDNTTFFPLGTTTVTFRFMDDAGNIGSATADVTVDLFYGDLNDDTFVNAGDSVILANFLVGNLAQGVPPFTAPLAAADLNNAGGVNSVDSVILANFLVGNITCLPQ